MKRIAFILTLLSVFVVGCGVQPPTDPGDIIFDPGVTDTVVQVRINEIRNTRADKYETDISVWVDNLDTEGKFISFDPNIKNWEEAGLNDPNFNTIYILPGDYEDWGPMKITVSGTADQMRVIKYFNPDNEDLHFNYDLGDPIAKVVPFDLRTQQYVLIHDLWFESNDASKEFKNPDGSVTLYTGTGPLKMADSQYCIIDGIHYTKMIAGFRAFNVNNCVFQNMFFFDKVNAPGDIGGFQLTAYWENASNDNKIVLNRWRNVTDGVGFSFNHKAGATPPYPRNSQTGNLNRNLLAGNEVWVDETYYSSTPCTHPKVIDSTGDLLEFECACAEGGYDFKMGMSGDNMGNANIIADNIFYGFRPTDQTCGGTGDAGAIFVTHLDAAGYIIRGNVGYNSTVGFNVFGVDKKKFPAERGSALLSIEDNMFHNMVDVYEGIDQISANSGVAIRLGGNLTKDSRINITGNYFSDCKSAFSFPRNRKDEFLLDFVGEDNTYRNLEHIFIKHD